MVCILKLKQTVRFFFLFSLGVRFVTLMSCFVTLVLRSGAEASKSQLIIFFISALPPGSSFSMATDTIPFFVNALFLPS